MTDDKKALEFVRSRLPVNVERDVYERRFEILQRFVRVENSNLAPSPAAMQLLLLRTYNESFLDSADLRLLENQNNLKTRLERCANDLGETSIGGPLGGNAFSRTWKTIYVVFEAYAVLSLSCLKPGVPITHYACDQFSRAMYPAILFNRMGALYKAFEQKPDKYSDAIILFRKNTVESAALAKDICTFFVTAQSRDIKQEPQRPQNNEPLPSESSDASLQQNLGGSGSDSEKSDEAENEGGDADDESVAEEERS